MKLTRFLITWGTVALAAVAIYLLHRHSQEHPWTRDAQVRANVVGIAPRISGPVVNIPIKDNQVVRKGDLLFEIDPATYETAVARANAEVLQAEAKATEASQELRRQTELFQSNATDQQTLENSQDNQRMTQANLAAARAAAETAKLNLSYAKVYAPVDGYVTNVQTSPGTYVNAGQELFALVDVSTFWVAAYFKETQIKDFRPGRRARITLMGHVSEPFDGEVDSVGWGIYVMNGATVDLLPQIDQTIDWIRLPNRFAVRIRVTGKPPGPLRIGQTASVAVE